MKQTLRAVFVVPVALKCFSMARVARYGKKAGALAPPSELTGLGLIAIPEMGEAGRIAFGFDPALHAGVVHDGFH
jgi:hypothetical protein